MGKATIIEAQNSSTIYEEGNKSGILGKLKGIFADYKHGTRNADRLYTEELWDNRVFGSEDVMEALETKTLFGELDHPEGDRCETLAKNAAISITKLEKKPEEGVIYGEAEILDTPTGRIVKALADSGAKLGISSRGMGEEIYENGQNIIDPETYDFITFDVVVTPANTKARVSLTENKHLNALTENFKKEIKESETSNQLNQIKKVIENTNISDKDSILESINLKIREIDNIKVSPKLEEANRQIALDLLRTKLDETINANNQLSEENMKLIEENEFYKDSKNLLKDKLKEAKCNNQEEIDNLKKELDEAKTEVNLYKTKIIESEKNQEVTLNKVKEVKERKIENLEANYKDQIAKLQEEKELAERKFNNLLESNKKLTKNLDESSKIILENSELKKKIESLEAEKVNSSRKLTENRLQEANKIKALQERVKSLEAEKSKMEEAEDRLSKLAFNPIGTVKAVAENFRQNDYTQDELDLYNALVGK